MKKTKPPSSTPVIPANVSDEDYWRSTLQDIEGWLQGAEQDGGWTAVASLTVRRNEAHRELTAAIARTEAIEAEKIAAERASRDSAAVFAGIIDMAREMPEELREQLLAALAHQPILKVVGG